MAPTAALNIAYIAREYENVKMSCGKGDGLDVLPKQRSGSSLPNRRAQKKKSLHLKARKSRGGGKPCPVSIVGDKMRGRRWFWPSHIVLW